MKQNVLGTIWLLKLWWNRDHGFESIMMREIFGTICLLTLLCDSFEQGISTSHEFTRRSMIQHEPVKALSTYKHMSTIIELTGHDRPGLMSEISALLTGMGCNIVATDLWTHNMRVACILYVSDGATRGPIQDHNKLHKIKDSLSNVLRGDKDFRGVRTEFAASIIHTERRLHQLMFADRDYEKGCSNGGGGDDDGDADEDYEDLEQDTFNGKITVDDCQEKDYSVVNIHCRNRPKLLFDIVCTLTDMQYVVFHATIDSDGDRACQVS
jgi:predicted amino acid-binding ACT domain protein